VRPSRSNYWQLRMPIRAFFSLLDRPMPTPRQTLDNRRMDQRMRQPRRSPAPVPRPASRHGAGPRPPPPPDTQTTRSNIAACTGDCGLFGSDASWNRSIRQNATREPIAVSWPLGRYWCRVFALRCCRRLVRSNPGSRGKVGAQGVPRSSRPRWRARCGRARRTNGPSGTGRCGRR
jgi:hypothetical protein